MVGSDVYLTWGDFHTNMSAKFKSYIKRPDLADVTLVCQDNKKIPAHRIILSSGCSFFREVFREQNSHPHPLIYLRGVVNEVLEAIIQFLYLGETSIQQDLVEEFMATAADLDIEGLVNKDFSEDLQSSRTNIDCQINEVRGDGDKVIYNVAEMIKTEVTGNCEVRIAKAKFTFPEKDINGRYPCNLCGKEFRDRSNYIRHHKKRHTKLVQRLLKSEDNQVAATVVEGGIYECDYCSFSSNAQKELRNHAVRHIDMETDIIVPERDTNGLFPCDLCEKRIRDKGNYKRHFKMVHLRTQYCCNECEFSTTYKETLKRHMKTKHITS